MFINITKIGDIAGFTLIEILVAVFLIAIGFFAMSQMQFLSLRQSQMAENGTIATNIIQAVSENDLAEIRNIHKLNLNYLNNPIDNSYCTTGSGNICSGTCQSRRCCPPTCMAQNPSPVS